MQIFVPKETHSGERRIALIPPFAEKLVKLGAQIRVERGLGHDLGFSEKNFTQVGVTIAKDRKGSFQEADLVLRVRKPEQSEVPLFKKGCILISFLEPFTSMDLIQSLAKAGVSSICMELIPRITRAQKLDALSSQANLAGYYAVILAAERLDKIFPMMMTPAGTIAPSRVFIIGAGVAGLQAIATAKRLGATVEAFDTRPAVEEQIKSLGARFIKVELGATGETKDGYAKVLSQEQLQKQREVMAKHCALADVVITTAQVFGKKAPRIITSDMIQGMKPGSIIIDLAIETGGNVEGSILDEEIEMEGVKIIGLSNLPSQVAVHASQMYSSNVMNLIAEFWDKEKKAFQLKPEDEIIKSSLITHQGEIIHPMIQELIK